MGGSAFSSGTDPLYTPRMPFPVYDKMRKHCTSLLSDLFRTVASPTDGPGKSDYGDVDMLVSGPLAPETTLQDVAKALHARRSIFYGSRSANFALEWPAEFASVAEEEGKREDEDNREQEEEEKQEQRRYVQVDVCVCLGDDALSWLLFKHAHGDLGSILGAIVRPYGLSLTEHGLYIRIPEMEASRPRQACVFVTRDADTALQILGLPAERFWSGPFDDVDDMYEFAALCPMFSVGVDDDDDDDDGGQDNLRPQVRRRMRSRPVFRRWKIDFRSRCRQKGLFLHARTSREAMTKTVMETFPSVQTAFKTRLFSFLREQQELTIRNEVIPSVVSASAAKQKQAKPQVAVAYRACLSKALARLVLEGDESFGVDVRRPDDGFVDGGSGLLDLDRVAAFVEEHCEAVAAVAMERHWAALRAARVSRQKGGEKKEEEES
ncbi:hypothetical protein CP533_3573 [Ophiocordyceps camponoti-saundersi (nom. inval.)]|nr:hypothetical protein CP533_3573 [Ophiocordyceps camponoti-saundersi (nom. inval.)]